MAVIQQRSFLDMRARGDWLRLRTLVATRDASDRKLYHWDVRLRGEGETAFIELS